MLTDIVIQFSIFLAHLDGDDNGLHPLEILFDSRVGLADVVATVGHPVPDLMELGQVPVIEDLLEGAAPLGLDLKEPALLDISDVKLCLGPQRVVPKSTDREHISILERAVAHHRCRHGPDDRVSGLDELVEMLARTVLGAVCQDLLALIEDEEHPLALDEREQVVKISPGFVIVQYEYLRSLLVPGFSLRRRSIIDHGLQGGGLLEEVGQVRLELHQGEGQNDVGLAPVDHLLRPSTGEHAVVGDGMTTGDIKTVRCIHRNAHLILVYTLLDN